MAANTSGAESAHASVLDKYPERDLSRLSDAGNTGSPSESTHHGSTVSGTFPEAVRHDTADDSATIPPDEIFPTAGEEATEGTMNKSGSKSPIIAILSIVIVLLVIAFIWHVNPWPSVRESIAGLFGASSARTPETVVKTTPSTAATEEAPVMRTWDFFLQVSSWKELGQADLDAERYRAQNLDVIVESEFIPAKGGTWYRVRLGPYESSDAAREILTSSAGLLPKGAYVDSVRLSEDQPVTPQSTSKTSTRTKDSRTDDARRSDAGRRSEPRDATVTDRNQRLPGRDFELIDQPMSGWAVKVSSLKTEDLARQEARKILEQGYPSFIMRKNIGGTPWYRVLVGPFSDKRDADRYQQLLNVTYGNDAYTVNLSTD
jgi:cell division protein FtsN